MARMFFDLMFTIAVCFIIFVQVDTWKQARQTNEFIATILDAVKEGK